MTMLKWTAPIIAALISTNLWAASIFDQIQKDTEHLAMLTMIDQANQGKVEYTGNVAGIGEWVLGKAQEITVVTAALIQAFDANGNNRIDPGPEWEALREALTMLAVSYGDQIGNSDGKLSLDDLPGISEFFFQTFTNLAIQQLCGLDLLAKVGIYTPWYKSNCQ